MDQGLSSHTAARWNQHWARHDSVDLPKSKIEVATALLAPVFDAIERGETVHLLDAGCGNGVHVEVLERLLARPDIDESRFSGWAVDLSPEALEATGRRIRSGRWRTEVADATALPFEDRTFDVTLSVGIACLCDDPGLVVAEAMRVTRPGGRVAIYSNADTSMFTRLGLSAARGLGNSFAGRPRQLIAGLAAPIVGFLQPGSGVSRADGGYESSREIASSNLSSPITRFLRSDDLRRWIDRAGMEIECEDAGRPFTAWCRVPGSAAPSTPRSSPPRLP